MQLSNLKKYDTQYFCLCLGLFQSIQSRYVMCLVLYLEREKIRLFPLHVHNLCKQIAIVTQAINISVKMLLGHTLECHSPLRFFSFSIARESELLHLPFSVINELIYKSTTMVLCYALLDDFTFFSCFFKCCYRFHI